MFQCGQLWGNMLGILVYVFASFSKKTLKSGKAWLKFGEIEAVSVVRRRANTSEIECKICKKHRKTTNVCFSRSPPMRSKLKSPKNREVVNTTGVSFYFSSARVLFCRHEYKYERQINDTYEGRVKRHT